MTPTHPCTVCGRLETVHFMGMPQMPVHCNVLWPTPAGARQAPRGDIQLHFCPTCGHVFNADFDPALMARVNELRAAGEIVINTLSAGPDPRCDRQLVDVGGEWQVQAL